MSQDLAELVLKPIFSKFQNLSSFYHATEFPRKGKQIHIKQDQNVNDRREEFHGREKHFALSWTGISLSFDLCLGREDHLYLQGRARLTEASFLILERPCSPKPVSQSASSNAQGASQICSVSFFTLPTKRVLSLIGATTKIKSGFCRETQKSSFNELPVYMSEPFMEWDGFYIFYLQLLTPFLREREGEKI